MKNPWILPAAALLIGGAGGFVAGKNGNAPAAPNETAATTSRSSRASAGTGGGEGGRSASRARSIEDIRTKPGQLGRIQALLDFYQNLDPTQLEAEAAKLENLPINERIMASILLFGRWAETDPLAAMAYSDKMGMAGMFAKPTILQGWASTDPENAAKYFAEHPREFAMMGMGPMGGGRNGGGGGASLIAAEWAKSNPEAALAWAQTLKGNDKDQAMNSVVRELAMTNPQKAVQLATTMEGDAKTNAYESIAAQWGAKNFSEAEAWIKTLPADQQDAVMASAIRSLANQDPQTASTKIASMTDGDSKNRAISEVVDAWSRENPAKAAAWLSTQNAEASGRAMRDLMGNWARQDDAGALAYLSSQPAGEARDQATQAYVWSNRSADPKSVMTLAESITDEGDRQRAVGVAAMQWMQTDPEAAKAYIQSSTTISDEAKQRLQEGGGRGFGGRGGFGGGGGRRGGN